MAEDNEQADNSDIAQMGDEELMDAWTREGAEVQRLRARLSAYSAEHQRRNRKAQLAAQFAQVSEADMALLQEVRTESIESEESVLSGDEG